MKKIIIIHHNRNIGGSGRSLVEVANNLSDRFEIKVLCPDDSYMYGFLRAKGLNVIPYTMTVGTIEYYNGGPKILSRTYFKRLFARPKFTSFVMDIIKKEKPDYVFLNSVVLSYLIPIIIKKNATCVSFVRETFPKNGLKFMYNKYKRLLSLCNLVFFLSDFDRNFYSLSNGVTLRNTVDHRFFEEIPKSVARKNLGIKESGMFSVLFVGGTSGLKGAYLLSEASKLLPEDMELVVCGDEIKKTEEVFKDANCKVTHLDFCYDMESSLYSVDALVFPSTKPHQARPVFEAGAAKKPVIISDFPETSEQVTDNVNGLTFIPNDARDLASKIILLKNDPALCQRLGMENFNVTKRNNSREAAKETLKVIN